MLKKMVGEDSKLTTKSNVDLSKLPPSFDYLKPHIFRVNYRLATYKKAHESLYWKPKPWDENQGWVKNDGVLEPLWSIRPVLPQSLVDILDTTTDSLDDEFVDTEICDEEIDFKEMFNEDLDD